MKSKRRLTEIIEDSITGTPASSHNGIRRSQRLREGYHRVDSSEDGKGRLRQSNFEEVKDKENSIDHFRLGGVFSKRALKRGGIRLEKNKKTFGIGL